MRVIITEKPSVARDLAKVFGATIKRDGYIEGTGYFFTWAFGHLLQLAPPQDYGYIGWKAKNLPMVPQRLRLTVRKVKTKDGLIEDPSIRKQLNIIKMLFDVCTEIIVATDAGREGELIFRYIYRYLQCKKPFRRLWISSQTDNAIKEGFRNLKPGQDYDTLFYSAHCRSESDWLVGMNATQALSVSAGARSVLSLGRVQTPTLGMICARYLGHKNFVPKTYYQLSILLQKDDQLFKAISKKNYNDKAEAAKILHSVEDVGTGFPNGAIILSVETKSKKEQPPLLHDLSSLQQEANKKRGLTADETLAIVQRLYEEKLVTYPRTGSQYIGDDVFATIPSLLEKQQNHPQFGKHAGYLLNHKLNRRSVNAKKVTDHHAILPTGERAGNLSTEKQAIYDMIIGRMLEAFHEVCTKDLTKITIKSGTMFVANGTVLRSAGWRSIYNESDENDKELENNKLPLVEEGNHLPIIRKELNEKQTKPKPLYTEASLLKAMETAGKEIEDEELRYAMKGSGLGTPATRASIIETLIKRSYILRQKKNLVPTDTGLAVYDIVKDKKIAQAELTGQWEKRLEEIREGASVKLFREEIKNYTKAITNELLIAGKSLSPVISGGAKQ
ncbi:DNA topoisomerase 3 [Olivibacter sp. SDN3]|uniref:DNA topoisomerase 3 n=1 Tax=Olivibacter sp. SDN3 TaxID=2764720 RepID=UPI0016519F99|nr:DNA topoisomerase 3 [Olivibacter sp. SDN3]QNL48900.1 DNA topoisomerase 3 [Olivibacter sp. SDN3]